MGAQGNSTVGWPRNSPWTGLPGFCHTSLHYVNPSCTSCNDDPTDNRTLFEVHPEFFWPNNLTMADVSSVCWAAPGIAEYFIRSVRAWMHKFPSWGINATWMSLTQEDTANVCMSDQEMAAVNAENGSFAAPMLKVVNEVARNLSKDRPDLLIYTLAYASTQKPPTITKPEDNVREHLCSSR